MKSFSCSNMPTGDGSCYLLSTLYHKVPMFQPPEFDPIEGAIKTALEEYSHQAIRDNYKKDSKWTEMLVAKLGRLGVANQFKVCASGFRGEFEKEWLYDIVWYNVEGHDEWLSRIPLVVECEWNKEPEEIKYDFEKLLVSNAEHRLMICYVHEANRKRIWDCFQNCIRNYLHLVKGDRFMVAMMDYNSYRFDFRLFTK